MSRTISPSVSGFWTTPVTLGFLKDIPKIPLESRAEISESLCRHEISLKAPESWESILIDIANHIIGSWVDSVYEKYKRVILVSMSIEEWKQGFEVPAYASKEDLHGWLFLEGTSAKHSDSGTVCVIDPRAGSDMCAVPGLPWGRPLILAPSAGAFAVVPGWLTSSVLPLEPGQESLVMRFSANLVHE